MSISKKIIISSFSIFLFLNTSVFAAAKNLIGNVPQLSDIESMNDWNDGYRYWNVILSNPYSFKVYCDVPFLTTTASDSVPTARHSVGIFMLPNGTNTKPLTIKKTFTFVSVGEVKCKELNPDEIIEQKKPIK